MLLMTGYHQLQFMVQDELSELVAAELFESGCLGMQELSQRDRIAFFMEFDLAAAGACLAKHGIPFTSVPVEDKDWEAEWRRTLQPIQLTDRFTVTPSWLKESVPAERRIMIDPKMTFGSGHHETTRMCAQFLQEHGKGLTSLLDVGTGTGILPIVAKKIGMRAIFALDNDPAITENLRENLDQNECGSVNCFIGTIENIKPVRHFDVVTVNIISSVIIEMLPELIALMGIESRIIFSGILVHEKKTFLAKLEENKLIVLSDNHLGEWYGVVAVKTI